MTVLTINKALGYDPTRTTALRRSFVKQLKDRLKQVRREITHVLVQQDNFYLVKNIAPREAYAFASDSMKLSDFNAWFKEQADANLLTLQPGTGQPWSTTYVDSAYRKGAMRAYLDAHKADLTGPSDFYKGDQSAFLRDAFTQGEMYSKLEMVATRTFEELKGVTAAMGQQMNRIMAEGLANGNHPNVIARDMFKQIGKLERTRYRVIARTEVIRAHAEGQLDSFTLLGVDRLGVKAEWSTAGDDRVCEQCLGMEAETFTIDEARGLIPLHPQCRCAWIPAEDTKRQRAQRRQSRAAASRRLGLREGPHSDLQGAIRTDIDAGTLRTTDELWSKYGNNTLARRWVLDDAAYAAVREQAKTTAVSDPHAKQYIADIVNGRHRPSLFKVGSHYYDPGLRQLGVSQKNIDELGKYLTKLYENAGVKMVRGGGKVPKIKIPKAPKLPPKPPTTTTVAPPAPVAEGTRYATAEEYRQAIIKAVEQKKLSAQTEEYLELVARRDHLKKRMLDVKSSRQKITTADPRWQQLQAEEDAVRRDIWKLDDRIEAYKSKGKLDVESQRAFLHESDSMLGSFETRNLGQYKDTADELLKWVPRSRKIPSQYNFSNVNVKYVNGETGAGSYNALSNRIIIENGHRFTKTTEKTFAHEFGHHLSYNLQGAYRAQTDFFKLRTAGEKIQQIPGYQSHIRGKLDKWSKWRSYAGRVYEDGHAPEVFSVGMETIWANPYKAATTDPEWFNLMISQLKGIPVKQGAKVVQEAGGVAARVSGRTLKTAKKAKSVVDVRKIETQIQALKAKQAALPTEGQFEAWTKLHRKIKALEAKLPKLPEPRTKTGAAKALPKKAKSLSKKKATPKPAKVKGETDKLATTRESMNDVIDKKIKTQKLNPAHDNYDLPLECHETVEELYVQFGDVKGVEYVMWKEELEDKVYDLIAKKSVTFGDAAADDLITAMKHGWVNGHSFIKVGKHYVDPYLAGEGATQEAIDKLGAYLHKIYKQAGMVE